MRGEYEGAGFHTPLIQSIPLLTGDLCTIDSVNIIKKKKEST